MNDLISRQAAIDEINHICPVDTEYDCALLDRVDVRCVLSDLPPAGPRWIPVTERLPENEQDVLVTVNDGCTHVETDYFTGAHFLNYWDEVLAWMPLPEPWKGEADDTD